MYIICGNHNYIKSYYDPNLILTRNNNKQIRPLYARLQRELIKEHHGMTLDPANYELILSFAAIHSHLNKGALPKEVKTLLKAVLKQDSTQHLAKLLLSRDANNVKK